MFKFGLTSFTVPIEWILNFLCIKLRNVVNTFKLKRAKSNDQKKRDKHIKRGH